MAETVRLKLPLLAAAQAQKHVTHNEALAALDTLVQLSVIDKDLATPPMSPTEGDCYVVAGSATGAWTGWETRIARFIDGAWRSYIPAEGWRAYVEDEAVSYVFDGAAWVTLAIAGYLPLTGGTLSGNLGVGGATPDATNRLAVASPAILLNRETDDIQVKLNKEAAGDDAAFIFQTGFSTRALIGLLGDDDFTFKVSPDGSAFHTGFALDKDNGNASFSGLVSLLAGQLAFPATQNPSADPNTLDDYEEGTWTPTFTTTGTPPTGVTYSNQIGHYTRIGNLISIWVNMTLTSKGTGGTGNGRINGLPFSVASTGGGVTAQGGHFENITLPASRSWLVLTPILGSSLLGVFGLGSAVSGQNINWANWSDTSAVIGNCIYF